MNLSSDPYIWVAAILTLFVFSFLYKDNVFFCFAEHLVVGLSTGYLVCIAWNNVFVPELIVPLYTQGFSKHAHLWVSVLLCFCWACKYFAWGKDLFRLALAFWVAIDLGMTIPMFMEAKVLRQVASTVQLSYDGSLVEIVGNLVLALGTATGLCYFLFSRRHTGPLGIAAKMGIWVLMVGFGATFSYVVLSRIYLLIGRLVFLMRDWLGIIA